MASQNQKLWFISITTIFSKNSRFYSSKSKLNSLQWRLIRPKVLKRIEKRAEHYPLKSFIPVAQQVLNAQKTLHHGVSLLLQTFPIWTCKCCSEVYVGENGHLIKTCNGFNRQRKGLPHKWMKGSIKDILIPVETFRLPDLRQRVVHHNERFDYDRVLAVLELCKQAGAEPSNTSTNVDLDTVEAASVEHDLQVIGKKTFEAWEIVRSGIEKLLCVYPVKVCRYCSEVQVGVSGHKARLCGVFKFQSWRGKHRWQAAKVDNLIPQKVVWFKRPQDSPVLVDEGQKWYGHAPVVVDLCSKAGAIIPKKYHCMMKINGGTFYDSYSNQK